MASIESLGLGSGVLTTDLVDKLMKAEREVAELRLNNRQELVDAKITAYGEIKSMMSKLQSTAGSLASPSLVGSTVVTSSDESILTATGSVTADPGTYNVEVLNTAKSHALATGTFSSYDTIIGTGKLVFTFGELNYGVGGDVTGQTVNPNRPSKTITIDDSNRTLAGVRDAINNAKMGVTASIVNDGTGYRLLMTSTETGVQNAIRIEAQDGSGNLVSNGLAALAYNENQNSAGNLTQTSRAEDAQVRVNGLTISRSSNAIDEVVKGVTLNLKNADVGKNVSIEVKPDTEQLSKTLQSFVDTYNELKGFVDSLSGFDAKTNSGGLLMGDTTVRTMMSQVRSLISQPIVGLSGKYRSLTELGVNTNTNNKNLLDFDPAKLSKALSEDRSSLIGLLAKTGISSDSQIIYVNDSVNTKPGAYDVVITQLATQATYDGAALSLLDFSSPVTIDSSNNNFTINVNGQSAAIELKQGSYASGDELAKQIALQINSNETFSQYGSSVSVAYDAVKKNFSITSNLYGKDSTVYFTSVDTNTANTLGFNILGGGGSQGVGLTTLNAEAFNGKGATTVPGLRTVSEDLGINFSTSNATFALSLNGAPAVNITVNQNASNSDLNGDGKFGTRADTLQAIQNAIDSSSLGGQVLANFDKNGYLTFMTTAVGANQSIEIASVGSSTSDVLLGLDASVGPVSNGKNTGVTLTADATFDIEIDGETRTGVSVPAGNYATGADLAAAIQQALADRLQNDSAVQPATTAFAALDISQPTDFQISTGFRVNVNGTEKEITVSPSAIAAYLGSNDHSTSVVKAVQDQLDLAFGTNVVTASTNGMQMQLSTVQTGRDQFIEVTGDGRGASVAGGNINTGIDFTSQNAAFTLSIGGSNGSSPIDINVVVNGNGTSGSNDSASNLREIQAALNDALVASGQFAEGDVVAKLDENGNLLFETVSKNGVRTFDTYGGNAALEIKNVNANATSLLGLPSSGSGQVQNGYSGYGFPLNTRNFGYDLNPEVEYTYDPATKLGSFEISVGGRATQVGFSNLNNEAISILGLQDSSTYMASAPRGKDVAGTINGVEASGSGQFLRATDGTIAATNGYYLGNTAADFSTPVVLDADNSTFSISVDGVNAEISLNYPATYNSGAALASALQSAINNHADFKAKEIAVKVDFTNDPTSFAHNKFGIISASTGVKSEVKLTSVPAGVAAVFGFVSGYGDGDKGKDQVGSTDAASGLRVKVTGGSLGARGSLTYVSGFGDLLKDIMDGFLNGKNSLMTVRENAFDRETETISENRQKLEVRLAAQEARLKSQFAYNDAIVASLNTTLDYVKQQFEAMSNSKK